ncbi:MAG TPA: cytochrome c-type biogenesis CcmF C-terminal domain-containing protein [Candidatus Angelobacter sp.]
MPIIGSFCLLFALVLSAYCMVAGIVALRSGKPAAPRLGESARRAGMAAFIATAVAAMALVYATLNNDFSLAYIRAHSNRTLPIPYKFAVLWSGQEGSMLFWALLLSAYGFVLRLRHRVDRRLVAHASVILAGIQTFFLIVVNFSANPFGVLDRVPADGNGLNALLEYPQMVIHPPMLYLGYVGMSVPFAFGLAALIMKYPGEKWIHITRRWTMVAWLFLTVGIFLGANWAYYVLGWGGYWGWDPVENASLLPWITGTAFLHSVMMQEKRGMMKTWNMWLIFTTFFLSIFGTFLTRSGVINSVHSFALSSIGAWFMGDFGRLPYFPFFYAYPGFLEIAIAVCVYFYFKNRSHLAAENKLEALVSRESSFMFNNLVLLAACFAVLWGTLFPVLSDWIQGHKITVGPPFFNRINVPIGLFLLFLTAIGPILAWRRTSFASVSRNFAFPASAAALTAIVLIAAGMRPWQDIWQIYSLIAFSLSALVIAAVASEFYRGGRVLQSKLKTNLLGAMYHLTRRNTRRYGGYIVHFGVVLIVIGLAGRAFNLEKEQEIGLHEKLQIGHYELVGQTYTEDHYEHYDSLAVMLDVYKDGKFIKTMFPEARTYQPGQANAQRDNKVAIRTTLAEDLYIRYDGFNTETDRPIITAFVNPLVVWVWIGVLVIVFGTCVALVPNAAQLKSPVPVSVMVRGDKPQVLEPAGAVK